MATALAGECAAIVSGNQDLDALVDPTAPGDPDSPLRWSCKSVRTLAVALQALGHAVSHTVIAVCPRPAP